MRSEIQSLESSRSSSSSRWRQEEELERALATSRRGRAYKGATRSQDEDSLRSSWSDLALSRLLRRQSRGGRSTLWLTARAVAPGCHEQLRGHEPATAEAPRGGPPVRPPLVAD